MNRRSRSVLGAVVLFQLVGAMGARGAAAAEAVLHDNGYDFTGPVGSFTSQDFRENRYDSQAADDFVVSGNWTINRILVSGELYHRIDKRLAKVPRVNVFFYRNQADNRPGLEILGSYRSVVPIVDIWGDLTIDLSSNPVQLGKGKSWISVQSVQDELVEGQWFWTSGGYNLNSSAVWRNPGNGFSHPNCTTWNTIDACFFPSAWDDLSWRLTGTKS